MTVLAAHISRQLRLAGFNVGRSQSQRDTAIRVKQVGDSVVVSVITSDSGLANDLIRVLREHKWDCTEPESQEYREVFWVHKNGQERN